METPKIASMAKEFGRQQSQNLGRRTLQRRSRTEYIIECDYLFWPHRDYLIWPHLASNIGEVRR